MVQLLKQWGFACVAAETGDEALTLARSYLPELVICDWRLRGGEQGTDVISRLRAQSGHALPAILVTGDTSPDRLQEAARLNLPVLHKPVSPADLHSAMARVVGDFARSA
jgi:CheY-like chemotaxis protein